MKKSKKILIFTGGTGGHVIPAKNLANFLISKGYSCSIILDKRGKKYMNNFEGTIYSTHSSHLSGSFIHKTKSILNLIIGFFESLILLIKLKPCRCISFGGYATFMPLIASILLKRFFNIKIFMHEQNSVIGKVNLFFLPYVENIFTNFENLVNLNEKFLFKKVHTSLPLAKKNFFKISNEFKINNKINIFIYGGSQGSVNVINNSLLMIEKLDSNVLNKIYLIFQSPKSMFGIIEKKMKILKIDCKIKEFYKNIDEILTISDLAISRAGAGTINDLIKYQIPSIIFPLHFSKNNHPGTSHGEQV